MNDRYLYKAKIVEYTGNNVNVGEWVVGCLVVNESATDKFKYRIQPIEDGFLFAPPINPSTICQCTGLKDKNGELIWENDVVNCFEAECCGKISWNESEAGFYFDVLLEDGTYEEEHIYDYADCMMVIGNIFDNPELLEVES